jgi:hypothetical protein
LDFGFIRQQPLRHATADSENGLLIRSRPT